MGGPVRSLDLERAEHPSRRRGLERGCILIEPALGWTLFARPAQSGIMPTIRVRAKFELDIEVIAVQKETMGPGRPIIAGMHTIDIEARDALESLSGPVRDWFAGAFPEGPTPAQGLAWPAIAAGEHVLLVSPTGTGKTLAAFLAILDRLFRRHAEGTLAPGLRCVYVSPLRSLGYDIERNLADPARGRSGGGSGCGESPIRVGVRTGDTSAYVRRKLRDEPPHLLITTPESLSLLAQPGGWGDALAAASSTSSSTRSTRWCRPSAGPTWPSRSSGWRPGRTAIPAASDCRPPAGRRAGRAVPGRADANLPRGRGAPAPRHAAPGARGRVADRARRGAASRPDLSPAAPAAAPGDDGQPDDGRLRQHPAVHREDHARPEARPETSGSRARTVRRKPASRGRPSRPITRRSMPAGAERSRRCSRQGRLEAVVTSTSLELGVDIGTADLTVQVGLPGGVARCVQRVGRSGHRLGAASRGLMLAATPAELAGAVVTARAARAGRLEPLRMVEAPLDVVCQQLVGMACAGECAGRGGLRRCSAKAGPMAELAGHDFDACLDFLAGDLAAPPGAFEPEPGAAPRWTSPRIWKRNGWFGVRSRRVTPLVLEQRRHDHLGRVGAGAGRRRGHRHARGRLRRAARPRRPVRARRPLAWSSAAARGRSSTPGPDGGEPSLPLWSSDRQSLSSELALELAEFRAEAARRLAREGPPALRAWLVESLDLGPKAAAVLVELIEAQEQLERGPRAARSAGRGVSARRRAGPDLHLPCPAQPRGVRGAGRATAARLGRRFGRDLALQAADLGWSIRLARGGRP